MNTDVTRPALEGDRSRQERPARHGARHRPAALLIAPASFHRVVYRRRLKHHLVRIASRLALSGLVLLLLALISALLLILDVVIGLGPALVLAVGALGWFVTWWFVLPVWSRIRHQAFAGHVPDEPDDRL